MISKNLVSKNEEYAEEIRQLEMKKVSTKHIILFGYMHLILLKNCFNFLF